MVVLALNFVDDEVVAGVVVVDDLRGGEGKEEEGAEEEGAEGAHCSGTVKGGRRAGRALLGL